MRGAFDWFLISLVLLHYIPMHPLLICLLGHPQKCINDFPLSCGDWTESQTEQTYAGFSLCLTQSWVFCCSLSRIWSLVWTHWTGWPLRKWWGYWQKCTRRVTMQQQQCQGFSKLQKLYLTVLILSSCDIWIKTWWLCRVCVHLIFIQGLALTWSGIAMWLSRKGWCLSLLEAMQAFSHNVGSWLNVHSWTWTETLDITGSVPLFTSCFLFASVLCTGELASITAPSW